MEDAHRLLCLNTWFSAGAVWKLVESLGGGALLCVCGTGDRLWECTVWPHLLFPLCDSCVQ